MTALTFLHRLAQNVFDLAVDAAQLVLRPGFKVNPERRINPQQKWFTFRHSFLTRFREPAPQE
jgi:hypothetical protein